MNIAALVLAAAALAAVLYLLISLKREMWQSDRASQQRVCDVMTAIDAVRSEMGDLRAQFADLEDRTGMLAPPPPVRSGLNMGRRAQAVRMLRRGETSGQIAAALGLPLNEAHLLAEVERLRQSDPSRRPAVQ